jgi:hypothetical protein
MLRSRRRSIDSYDHHPRQGPTTKEPRPGRPGAKHADNQSRDGHSNQRGRRAFFQSKFQENHMTNDTSQSDPQPRQDAWLAKYQDHARRVAEARPANKAALFDALTRAGITKVVVNFDGYGDSGQVERIDVQAGEAEAKLPKDQIELIEPVYGDQEKVERSTHTVTDAIETLVYAFLEETHSGWENDGGAYGEFTFDVGNRTIALDYSERYTESLYYSHTF